MAGVIWGFIQAQLEFIDFFINFYVIFLCWIVSDRSSHCVGNIWIGLINYTRDSDGMNWKYPFDHQSWAQEEL